jgi:diguanylate cyclase (GGDEF)-like protein
MLLVVGMRAADLAHARVRRMREGWSGRTEIGRWACGVLTTSALWAYFPLAFFGQLDQTERAMMSITLAAMAGGSLTVLGAERWLSITYCAALLVPASVMFLVTPGRENAFTGVLGFVYFFITVAATAITHNATMSAIRLNRANQALLVEMERERERTERANAELTIAQGELRQTLDTLEERIGLRTADLEHEIRERERYSRELARLASTDSLTGLLNRHTLLERLSQRLARAAPADEPIAVFFLDLDKFKEVNDVKGHHTGDHVLRSVAERLVTLMPGDAICARWGGDEFVFVLGAIPDHAWARAFAAQCRTRVAEPLLIEAEALRVDATIGVAFFPYDGRTPDDLIDAADMAMYAGKEDGRGRVHSFNAELADCVRSRHRLEKSLREATSSNALRLAFQPIVAAKSRRCHSVEALVRWTHPERGEIPPCEFIALAERCGEISAIGRWVLGAACTAAASWPGVTPPAVSVNVSVAQILCGSLVDDVRDALATSGLDARRLLLEVTESLFVSDHATILPTLHGLRSMGVRISLDDFGTGFSSLGRLQSLPIDMIKIDRLFVANMENEATPIIKSIRSLCRALDLQIVAEGVETARQAALLAAMDVHLLQGFWFAKPLSAERILSWLSDGIAERAPARIPSVSGSL